MEPQYASALYSNELNERQQYYNQQTPPPPPLPPPKPKKKSILKSPLTAIKRVFSKSTKPLRRQNSLVETNEQRPRPSLRRQQSMMESCRPMHMLTPDLSQRQYNEYNHNIQRYFARHEPFQPTSNKSTDEHSTYQNLETEAIYGNCGQNNYYEQENMYANRALIEFERRAVSQPPVPTYGGRIVRRHSMADRPPINAYHQVKREPFHESRHSRENTPQREDIYQTRGGSFMMQNSHNRREEEAIYQSRKEMHRDHLYQSKAEMQKRIHQGRIEAQRALSESPIFTGRIQVQPPPVELATSVVTPTKEQVLYQSRKELKERGFKTRTQLRDHIYQSRIEAMQSMAEPVYVSKRDVVKHEPIYESRESELDQSTKDVIEQKIDLSLNIVPQSIHNTNQQIHINDNDINSKHVINDKSTDKQQVDATNSRISLNDALTENIADDDDDVDDDQDTLTNANQSDIQKSAAAGTHSDVQQETPLSPRAQRAPFHISNIIKRTAPPPISSQSSSTTNSLVHASRTSIETQYTSSFASLAIGPPNAHSTPYASDITLGLPATQSQQIREQSTTHGVFDENGGTLCDNVWNVSINIPKGAIPKGVKQEIYFTVTDPRLSQAVGGPPLDMENGWCNLICFFFFVLCYSLFLL